MRRNSIAATRRWAPILALLLFLSPSLARAETPGALRLSGAEDPALGLHIERVSELRPLPETEILIPNFKAAVLSNGSIMLSGSGRERAGDPTTAIEFEADLVNETYRTRRVDAKEIEKVFAPAQSLQDENSSSAAVQGNGQAEIPAKIVRPGGWSGRVRVQTRDPIFLVLTETSSKLEWTTYTNGTVKWNRRTDSCSAANPSALGTHWFTKSCQPGTVWYTSSSRVCHEHRGSYYNYDFLVASKRTDASQYIMICGRNDGFFDYRWTHTDSGEGSFLIFGWLILN